MSSLFHAYSATLFSRTSHFVLRSSICRFPTHLLQKRSEYAALRSADIEFLVTKFSVRCYATRRASGSKSVKMKVDPVPIPMVKEENNPFFVVRKGDLVGVYKNLTDCQSQVGSSRVQRSIDAQGDRSISSLLWAENALYSIREADLTEGLFGTLVACPFQQPSRSRVEAPIQDRKRLQELLGPETLEVPGSVSLSNSTRKHAKLDNHLETDVLISGASCILEFDGASKGNPGQAGAGAVLRADDGTLICRVREGLGIATNNVAEYRAMILGLRFALEKGFTSVRVTGDSKLVCMQVNGLWKVKNQRISRWFEEAKKLKDKFLSFEITHVLRDSNSDADTQANLAVSLADGQVQEEIGA